MTTKQETKMTERAALFPPIEPNQTGMLPVDDLHTLYWEESGNPKGVPVLFVHGGPGGGTSPKNRLFFDPAHYRIILFDQRGAGKSTPMGEIRQNTTPLLISDMETLRKHLGVEKWHLFGGSWGSTLSLAYSIAHPDRVLGMVLRGIFLCRPEEIHWFYQEAGLIFPEYFRKLAEHIPEGERGNLVQAYYKRLNCGDRKVELEAARIWCWYEGSCCSLLPTQEVVNYLTEDHVAFCMARMETHYFMNDCFLPEGGLLAHIDKIRHIPTIIAHGRYDIVCPIKSADDLARAFPEAEYIIVPDAGHASSDPSLMVELVRATERMKKVK